MHTGGEKSETTKFEMERRNRIETRFESRENVVKLTHFKSKIVNIGSLQTSPHIARNYRWFFKAAIFSFTNESKSFGLTVSPIETVKVIVGASVSFSGSARFRIKRIAFQP